MTRKTLKFELTGESALLLHNGQTADPLNKYAKELKRVSSKRAKTDADFAEMAKIEWHAGLYTDDGKVCLPAELIEATILEAAKKQKLGKLAQSTVSVNKNSILHFPGDNLTIEELWNRDENRLTAGVRVNRSRIMRTRPMFNKWSCQIEVGFDDKIIDAQKIGEIVTIAGKEVGFADWRPKFGRFTVKKID